MGWPDSGEVAARNAANSNRGKLPVCWAFLICRLLIVFMCYLFLFLVWFWIFLMCALELPSAVHVLNPIRRIPGPIHATPCLTALRAGADEQIEVPARTS